MIQYTERDSVPFIGQPLHYHPDKHTRLAAFVVEVHPIERNEATGEIIRPLVDLQICKLDGTMQFRKGVPSFDDNLNEKCWSFQNEKAVLPDPDTDNDEEILGSRNNVHVS